MGLGGETRGLEGTRDWGGLSRGFTLYLQSTGDH